MCVSKCVGVCVIDKMLLLAEAGKYRGEPQFNMSSCDEKMGEKKALGEYREK